jgi:hypothetical protein
LAALADGKSEEILTAVIAAAIAGDIAAARLIFERIWPPRKGSPVTIDLPDVSDVTATGEAVAKVIAAVSRGELSPDEGASIASLIEARRSAADLEMIASRIAALELKMRQ